MKRIITLLLLTAGLFYYTNAVEFTQSSKFTANSYTELIANNENSLIQLTDIGLLESTDGDTWINLDNDIDLQSVSDLELDNEGNIFMIMDGMVMMSDDNAFTWNEIMAGISSSSVNEIEIINDAVLFASTSDGALRFDVSSMEWTELQLDAENESILSIGEDSEGNLLISSSESGLSLSKDLGLSFTGLDLNLIGGGNGNSVLATAIETDSDGNIMIGTDDGQIMVVNRNTLDISTMLESNVINDRITGLKSDAGDFGILVSTKNNGVFSSNDGKNFVSINSNSMLMSNLELTSEGELLFVDENGLMVGTSSNNLGMLDISYDASSVLAFASDGTNKFVITANSTLSSMNEGFIKIGDGSGETMEINDVEIIGSATIAATSEGVFKFDESSESWIELVSSSETGNTTEIEMASNNSILVGTDNGLLISDDATFSSYAVVDFTGTLDTDTEVTSVDVASNGQINVTNNTLLYTSDDDGETFETVDLGLTLSLIGSVEWDSQGNVFLGTNTNGLFKSDNNGVTFTKLDGVLENENIVSIETQNNKLFVQTDNALMVSEDAGASFDNLTSDLNFTSISSVKFNSNSRIEILTDSGIFTSNDSGESFEEEELMINTGLMTDISADSEGNLVLSTESMGLFSSMDEGMTWNNLSSNIDAETINSLQIDSENNIYAATMSGLMVSSDMGESFELVSNSELQQNIDNVSLSSDGRLMVMFGTNSKIAVMNDEGNFDILNVDGEEEGMVTANIDGELISASTEDGLFVSIDGGANFTEVENEEGSSTEVSGIINISSNSESTVLSTDNMLLTMEQEGATDITGNLNIQNITKIEIDEDGHLIVMGDNMLELSNSTDFSQFTDITSTVNSNSILNFTTTSTSELMIVTEEGLFAGSVDNTTKSMLEIDLTDINFTGMDIFNESNIMATSEGGLFISTTEGSSFDNIILEGRTIIDAALTNSSNIFASTEENGFLELNMNGEILSNLSAEFNNEIVNMVESDGESTIIASSDNVIMISEDAGSTWSELEGEVTSVSNIFSDTEGNLLLTAEEGSTFMVNNTNSTVNEINFSGDGNTITGFGTNLKGDLFISSETSGVVKSEDMGNTFVDVSNGLNTNAILELTSSESGNIYALTADAVFQFDSQTDTWLNVVNDTEGNFESATDLKAIVGSVLTLAQGSLQSNNDALVMTTESGVYSTTALSPASVSQEADRIINVYPNPANSLNEVNITLENASDADVRIYNSNGSVIAKIDNLTLNQGVNNVPVGLDNISAGSYYIELQLGNRLLTKQLIIVK